MSPDHRDRALRAVQECTHAYYPNGKAVERVACLSCIAYTLAEMQERYTANAEHLEARAEDYEALAARVRALEEVLRDLFALVEEGALVRNTTNDAHLPSYLAESVRLVSVLAAAKALLAAPAAGGGTGENHQ